MFRVSKSIVAGLAVLASVVIAAQAHAAADYRTIARLFGSTTLKGKAVYKENINNGQVRQDFKVQVENGIPGQSYSVNFNGAVLGTMTLNAFGRAELEFRTASFIDQDEDKLPLPPNFPRVNTGDLVTVGPLSGVFFDVQTTDVQRFRIEGDFSGQGLASGSVKYQERFKNGGLERRFDIEIEDASPGQTFNVVVRGNVVGTITAGAGGIGEFELRTAAFIDSPDDGQPMPNSFPSLKVGDTVQVGTMTAVLVED